MTRISPELALVDPELAQHVRDALPEPSDCLVADAAAGPILQSVDSEAGRHDREPGNRRRYETVAMVAVWIVVISLLATSFLAFISTGASSRPTLPPDGDRASTTGVTGVHRGVSSTVAGSDWEGGPALTSARAAARSGRSRCFGDTGCARAAAR